MSKQNAFCGLSLQNSKSINSMYNDQRTHMPSVAFAAVDNTKFSRLIPTQTLTLKMKSIKPICTNCSNINYSCSSDKYSKYSFADCNAVTTFIN